MIHCPESVKRLSVLTALVVLCSACGGGGTGDSPAMGAAQPDNPPLLVDDPVSSPLPGGSRELVVSESTTISKSIVQCFCDALYRSTLQIYHFPAQNAVLMIEFDNTTSAFDASAVLHLFESSASEQDVSRWINNQHSDGLFINPAQPLQSHPIGSQHITITSSAYAENLSGFNGDEYEKYQIEFTVANLLEVDAFHLNGFSDQADVYLQTRAPDFDN